MLYKNCNQVIRPRQVYRGILMLNDFYVYGHFKNGACLYVGAGRGYRARAFRSRSKRWHAIFSSPPEIRFFKIGLTQDEASEEEKRIIAEFRGSGHSLLNCTAGGEKGVAWSKGKKLSKQHCIAISIGKRGRSNGREGIKLSAEVRQRMSEARLNSDKAKAAGAKIWETRRVNGTAHGFTTAKARAVRCIDSGEIFRTAKEAAEQIAGSDKHIQACCVGRRMTHKKLRWEYV